MTSNTRPRFALVLGALLLATAAASAGYLAWRMTRAGAVDPASIASAGLGADFALTNHDGTTTRLSDLRGRAVLLFFGYTHCPDVCPSTLFSMAQARKLLGDDATRLQGVFITVDPERDTPERMKSYVAYFDPDFLALTGSVDELKKVARDFGAHFEKEAPDADGSYLVGHTTFGYLLDPEGKVVKLFQASESPEAMAQAVKAVL